MAGWFRAGALLAALAVALGAFGAHGLKGRVDPDMLAVWNTAAHYHLVHALALLATAWAGERWPSRLPGWAGRLFAVGILLFSGSLYAMVLTGQRFLGAITPFGGLAFLAAWIALARSARS